MVRSFFVDMARYQQDVLVVERAIAQAAAAEGWGRGLGWG